MEIKKTLPLKPRERGGAISSRGLLFQKHWALSLILKEFEKGSDFVVVFDYMDDIVVLRKTDSKETISFYQVKTKETDNWNESKLCGNKCLILTNLYENFLPYKDSLDDLKVISNTAFEYKDETLHVFNLSDLSDKYKEKLTQALQEEFKDTPLDLENFLLIAKFEKTPLSFDDMDSHITGIVNKFLENLSNYQISAVAFKKTLMAEIEMRHSCADKEFACHDDLYTKKGIDRDFIKEEVIEKLNTLKIRHALDTVSQFVHRGNPTAQEEIQAVRGYNQAYNDLLKSNLETITIYNEMYPIFNDELSKNHPSVYTTIKATVAAFLSISKNRLKEKQYGKYYLEGIAWNVCVSSN